MKLIPGDEKEEGGGAYLLRGNMNMKIWENVKKTEKSTFLQGVGYRVWDSWKV